MHITRPRPQVIGRCGDLPCLRRAVEVLLNVLLVRDVGVCVPERIFEQRGGVERWRSSGGGRSRRTRAGGSVIYSPTEWRSVEPLARSEPELAFTGEWDDREGCAAELCEGLQSNGASVWFSEKDVPLGTLLIREIDKGLKNSRVGIVLVTPALLKSIGSEASLRRSFPCCFQPAG